MVGVANSQTAYSSRTQNDRLKAHNAIANGTARIWMAWQWETALGNKTNNKFNWIDRYVTLSSFSLIFIFIFLIYIFIHFPDVF